MDNVKFKSVTAPAGYKATEYEDGVPVPSEGDVYQTTDSDIYESLKELYFGKTGEDAGATNPFSTISKAQSTPYGYSVDPVTGELMEDPVSNIDYVPKFEDIINGAKEKDILTLDTLEEIKNTYAKALKARKSKYAELNDLLLTGGLTSGEADSIKQRLNYLTKAIELCENAAQQAEKYKEELIANFAKEEAAVKDMMLANNLVEKFNSGTIQDKSDIIKDLPDYNGDYYIGDPKNGIVIVDTPTGLKALYDKTSETYIIRFSASGLPVSDKMPLPTEPTVLTGPGLMNTDMPPIKDGYDEDLVFEIDDSTPTETGVNIADAKVQMNIPEYMVVRIDPETGEAMTTTDDEGNTRYIPAKPKDGTTTVAAPTDPEKYIAVRITEVTVESATDDMGGKTDREGYDMIYTYYAGEDVACRIRVTGRNGTQGKNGSRPASDYAHAVKAGDFPITVDASGALFTGRHKISDGTLDAIRKEYLATDEDIKKQAGDKSGTALAAFEETMGHFKHSNSHVEENDINTTGIIIQGHGHFTGANGANNLFLVTDPGKIKGKEDWVKQTIIENSADSFYNAVFANGNGDVYAQNVTLAHIMAKDKDANIAVTMKAKQKHELESGGDIEDEADLQDINVKNYAAIIGKAANKWIDNPSDTDTHVGVDDKPIKYIGDDYFGGKNLAFTITSEGDAETAGDPDATSDDYAALDAETFMDEPLAGFDDAVSKLDKQMESPYEEGEDWEPDMGGDFYDSIKDDQQLFYSDLSTYFGFSNEGMSYTDGEDIDTSDIENPEKKA